VAPAAAFFVFRVRVLAVADEEVGAGGQFDEWGGGIDGRLVVGGEDEGGWPVPPGAVEAVGEAAAGMTGEGALHANHFLAGGKFHFLPRLHLAEGNFCLQLGKARRKVGFFLLGVEGLLDDVAGRPAGQAGGQDLDRVSLDVGGGEERKALEVIPVPVGKEEGEVFPARAEPVKAGAADAGASIDDEESVLAPFQTDAGGIAAVPVGGGLRVGGCGDAAAGAPKGELHAPPFSLGRGRARRRIFLSPTRFRSRRGKASRMKRPPQPPVPTSPGWREGECAGS